MMRRGIFIGGLVDDDQLLDEVAEECQRYYLLDDIEYSSFNWINCWHQERRSVQEQIKDAYIAISHSVGMLALTCFQLDGLENIVAISPPVPSSKASFSLGCLRLAADHLQASRYQTEDYPDRSGLIKSWLGAAATNYLGPAERKCLRNYDGFEVARQIQDYFKIPVSLLFQEQDQLFQPDQLTVANARDDGLGVRSLQNMGHDDFLIEPYHSLEAADMYYLLDRDHRA